MKSLARGMRTRGHLMLWPAVIQTFRQQDCSQPSQLTFIKLALGIQEQDVAVQSTCSQLLHRSWQRGHQACPRAMAKSGLVIYVLVITLLLEQTTSITSKFKARKHSKRRVKGKGASQSSKMLGLLSVGRGWTMFIFKLLQERLSLMAVQCHHMAFQETESPLNSLESLIFKRIM